MVLRLTGIGHGDALSIYLKTGAGRMAAERVTCKSREDRSRFPTILEVTTGTTDFGKCGTCGNDEILRDKTSI